MELKSGEPRFLTKYSYELMRTVVYSLFLLVGIVLVGCQDLAVDNQNQPNRQEVLASADDVPELAGTTFLNYWQGTMYCDGSMMVSTMADAHSASWGNWGMNDMSSEPRIEWNNSSFYPRSESAEDPWFDNWLAVSNGLDVIQSLEDLEQSDPKSRAFVNFSMGLALGHVAARFDRGYNVSNDLDADAVAAGESSVELVPYQDVRDLAIDRLNRAINLAENNDFTISADQDWVFGTTLTSSDLALLANSMKAKFTAINARTPQERQNLNWSQIYDFVQSGMEANGYSGPFGAVDHPGNPKGLSPIGDDDATEEFDCQKSYAQTWVWSRADYKTIGPADTTGSYQSWLDTPVGERTPYTTQTPDKRVKDPNMDGTVFGAPVKEGKYMTGDPFAAFFAAFPPARGTYHYSDRVTTRFDGVEGSDFGGGFNGPLTHTTKAEMDLLKAEAILQDPSLGSMDEVASLINNTRVENGELPPAEDSDPVGSISDDPNPIKDDGATLWSMLKYEHRIETMHTSAGLNYFTNRAWGDLPEGTPIHFPIPGEELNTLGRDLYTFGGVGGNCAIGSASNCIGGSGSTSSKVAAGSGPGALRFDIDLRRTRAQLPPEKTIPDLPNVRSEQ